MRTEKISEYVAHYILKHGYPRTTEDFRTVLKTTSQAVLVDAFDWLANDGWVERETKEQPDPQRRKDVQRLVDVRALEHNETHSESHHAAAHAAIMAIEAVIDACDEEMLDTTLDSFVTYIHARRDMIHAQRALLGEVQRGVNEARDPNDAGNT